VWLRTVVHLLVVGQPDRDSALPDAWEQPHHKLALCPFGSGPRKCIGELFARVEIQIHLMMFAKELRLRWCEGSLAGNYDRYQSAQQA
jgi:cytochrome P450